METSTAFRRASWGSDSVACALGDASEDVMEAGGEIVWPEGSEGDENCPLAARSSPSSSVCWGESGALCEGVKGEVDLERAVGTATGAGTGAGTGDDTCPTTATLTFSVDGALGRRLNLDTRAG
jgi:hypothetical protein